MRPHRLQDALKSLIEAINKVNGAIDEIRAEHDPLAMHIFVSRRYYRNMQDTKSGKRHETAARLGWNRACELGFRGDLFEWRRLMEARPKWG